MRPTTHERGRRAEEAAARWLEERGFAVLTHNFRTRVGEIDLVVLEGDTLCFVEVKARSGSRYGRAIEAVGPRRQRRLGRAAALYLARHPHDGPCRFDVLGLDRGGDGCWRFTLLRDAFQL